MSDLDLNMDDISSQSNMKRSWRTLIEFPTDKVACAIFVQETVSCMIKKKLVSTPEEIDEAMVKLYEMLKSNDGSGSVNSKCNTAPGDGCSDKDSVLSTCGTVANLESFDEDITEINGLYSYSIPDHYEKCCQDPCHYINNLHIGCAQLESPIDFILRSSLNNILSDQFPLENFPPPVHIRSPDIPNNIIDNDLNILNGSLCNHMTSQKNYVLVVEDKCFDKDVSIQTKKRSRKPRKNKNIDKRCVTNTDNVKEGSNPLRSSSFKHKEQDKSKSYKSAIETSKHFTPIEGCNNTEYQAAPDIYLPMQYRQDVLSLKPFRALALDRHSVLVQKQSVRVGYGFFSWMNTIYYLFETVFHLTKSVYHRIV